jgi:hypothetical protein
MVENTVKFARNQQITSNTETVKMPLAVNFFRAFSFLAQPLGVRAKEENNNDHGNRNLLPTPRLEPRPVSVPSSWDPAGYNDSRLPSSLDEWLASKEALVIH